MLQVKIPGIKFLFLRINKSIDRILMTMLKDASMKEMPMRPIKDLLNKHVLAERSFVHVGGHRNVTRFFRVFDEHF
jgi:hypothetical protein